MSLQGPPFILLLVKMASTTTQTGSGHASSPMRVSVRSMVLVCSPFPPKPIRTNIRPSPQHQHFSHDAGPFRESCPDLGHDPWLNVKNQHKHRTNGYFRYPEDMVDPNGPSLCCVLTFCHGSCPRSGHDWAKWTRIMGKMVMLRRGSNVGP